MIWAQRFHAGKVLDASGAALTLASLYRPQGKLLYFREVETEPSIPFTETILYQDDDLLVADKPHFLPVIPGGGYVAECLLGRLRQRTGIQDLTPLHRIDRETAGLVLFSVKKESRGRYAELFMAGGVEKSYLALSASVPGPERSAWEVENRIERGEPRFWMRIVPGEINARSLITLLEEKNGIARFLLQPLTGKTHQLRLHLSNLGFGILNDRYYPELQGESVDDFTAPLQLLSKKIRFRDPLSGAMREFCSERELWP